MITKVGQSTQLTRKDKKDMERIMRKFMNGEKVREDEVFKVGKLLLDYIGQDTTQETFIKDSKYKKMYLDQKEVKGYSVDMHNVLCDYHLGEIIKDNDFQALLDTTFHEHEHNNQELMRKLVESGELDIKKLPQQDIESSVLKDRWEIEDFINFQFYLGKTKGNEKEKELFSDKSIQNGLSDVSYFMRVYEVGARVNSIKMQYELIDKMQKDPDISSDIKEWMQNFVLSKVNESEEKEKEVIKKNKAKNDQIVEAFDKAILSAKIDSGVEFLKFRTNYFHGKSAIKNFELFKYFVKMNNAFIASAVQTAITNAPDYPKYKKQINEETLEFLKNSDYLSKEMLLEVLKCLDKKSIKEYGNNLIKTEKFTQLTAFMEAIKTESIDFYKKSTSQIIKSSKECLKEKGYSASVGLKIEELVEFYEKGKYINQACRNNKFEKFGDIIHKALNKYDGFFDKEQRDRFYKEYGHLSPELLEIKKMETISEYKRKFFYSIESEKYGEKYAEIKKEERLLDAIDCNSKYHDIEIEQLIGKLKEYVGGYIESSGFDFEKIEQQFQDIKNLEEINQLQSREGLKDIANTSTNIDKLTEQMLYGDDSMSR